MTAFCWLTHEALEDWDGSVARENIARCPNRHDGPPSITLHFIVDDDRSDVLVAEPEGRE